MSKGSAPLPQLGSRIRMRDRENCGVVVGYGRQDDTVIAIVEGYREPLWLHVAWIEEVLSTLDTQPTEEST